MDLTDMEAKIAAHPEARFMLDSHMLGKLCDMVKVVEVCKKHDITLIEDCAHTTGVYWGEEHTGHHGVLACYSTQSHKAMNSGEGGFLCTGALLYALRGNLRVCSRAWGQWRGTTAYCFLKQILPL